MSTKTNDLLPEATDWLECDRCGEVSAARKMFGNTCYYCSQLS